ncbi:MAG: hypothetical protein UV73_C0003G0129 [Candidatus Gottesmanbacteria bacterium GW2011_GWA2_43_14]|uniref:Uncharacterized protein n=1 Tax=Candidatus Gottesmanbacteria bacterium GW2011_GWA2_43_14 TaxID=1618443 RepID=A0A0G1DKU9_9BACT|nr:MAG: hypothetical protein UV73_C0003G0129 [Candidatus Gottesmanbacteria bacterium GW2011_GWA2_43_14]
MKIIGFIFPIIFLILPSSVSAAKKFVPKSAPSRKTTGTALIPASVKYRSDKRALFLQFTNINNIDSASYSLTYTASGKNEGVGGTISAANDPFKTRELLFGTCSTSVCTYHTGIKNAVLTITARLKNGRQAVKNYRIKTYN